MFWSWVKTFLATIFFIAGLLVYADQAHGESLYMCMAEQDDKGQPACWTGKKAVSPFRWLRSIAPTCELTRVVYVRDSKQEVSIVKLSCIEREKEGSISVNLSNK